MGPFAWHIGEVKETARHQYGRCRPPRHGSQGRTFPVRRSFRRVSLGRRCQVRLLVGMVVRLRLLVLMVEKAMRGLVTS